MDPLIFLASDVTQYFWGTEMTYGLIVMVIVAALLYRFRPNDRSVLFHTLGLYLASLIGLVLAGIAHRIAFPDGAAVLREASIILGGVALIRVLVMAVFRLVLPLVKVSPPHILEDIVAMAGYVAWGLVRLRYAGLDLSSIVTTSAVITAVIAFSMQDTLGNILGGLALQLDNSVQIGDWIKVDEVVGRVVDINWRSTAVETRNWETVVIPNSHLMKSKFLVLGRRIDQPLQWRRWVWFNVDFGVAPARVVSTVQAGVREAQIAHVAKEPVPDCVLMDFDKGYGRYAVRYWLTNLAADDPTDSEVRTHVYAALQRAGIRLAVPEYNIHTVKLDEKHQQEVKARELARRLKALHHVELFARLNEEELRTLAERLVYAPFARGDVMTRQGAVAHWLYIITAGEVEIYLEGPHQERHLLTVLPEGSFFGEMGLMTGAPRSATVVARTDVECYRLDKTSFADIIQSRPALAEEMSKVLAERHSQLMTAKEQFESRQDTDLDQHFEILDRIRRFFGLKGHP